MSEDVSVNTGAAQWPGVDSAYFAVRRMQTKLHRWAGEDPSRRFSDLFNLVYDPAFLMHAWERVSRNKGGRTPGIDKVIRHNSTSWRTTVCARLTPKASGSLPVRQVGKGSLWLVLRAPSTMLHEWMRPRRGRQEGRMRAPSATIVGPRCGVQFRGTTRSTWKDTQV